MATRVCVAGMYRSIGHMEFITFKPEFLMNRKRPAWTGNFSSYFDINATASFFRCLLALFDKIVFSSVLGEKSIEY